MSCIVRTLLCTLLVSGMILASGCSKPGESASRSPAKPLESPALQPKTAAGQARDEELRKAAEAVIHSIQTGDVEGFMGFVSKDGVCFGVDCDSEPVEKMRKDLNAKEGFYCLLFDTECERRTVLEMWKTAKHKGDIKTVLSFRDQLQLARIKGTAVDSQNGRVNFDFIGGNGSSSDTNRWSLDFGFEQENGAWRLNDIEYP